MSAWVDYGRKNGRSAGALKMVDRQCVGEQIARCWRRARQFGGRTPIVLGRNADGASFGPIPPPIMGESLQSKCGNPATHNARNPLGGNCLSFGLMRSPILVIELHCKPTHSVCFGIIQGMMPAQLNIFYIDFFYCFSKFATGNIQWLALNI